MKPQILVDCYRKFEKLNQWKCQGNMNTAQMTEVLKIAEESLIKLPDNRYQVAMP